MTRAKSSTNPLSHHKVTVIVEYGGHYDKDVLGALQKIAAKHQVDFRGDASGFDASMGTVYQTSQWRFVGEYPKIMSFMRDAYGRRSLGGVPWLAGQH